MYDGLFIPQILIQHLHFRKHCVSGDARINKTYYLPIEYYILGARIM